MQDFDSLLVLMLTASIFTPFYFSVIAVCGIAVMTMMNCKKREKVFSSPYTKFLLGFLVSSFFVSATYNNYWGMLYSIVMIAAAISGFYVKSVMTRPLFNKMMDTALIASVWCAFIAVYQKISCFSVAPRYRPISAFHNANTYGMIIEFIIIIAMYRIFTNPRMKKLYFAAIVLNMVGLYLCASLSAFLAVFFAVITILAFKGRYKLSGALILLACACVAVGVFCPSILPRGVGAIDTTLEQRLSIWATSIKGISLHPMIGTGPMSYQLVWERFGGYKTYHSHNLLLDTLLNFGVVGFAAIGFYMFMQLKLLVLRFKNNICRNMNILLVGAIVAVAVHGMTDVTIFWIQTGMLFLLIFSSTGIASEYLERKLRLPSILPEYSKEATARAVYLKN